MAMNLVNFFMQPQAVGNVNLQPVVEHTQRTGNPFITSSSYSKSEFYAKNKPVQGGYFAGYYNGKPNIVGQRLFIEV